MWSSWSFLDSPLRCRVVVPGFPVEMLVVSFAPLMSSWGEVVEVMVPISLRCSSWSFLDSDVVVVVVPGFPVEMLVVVVTGVSVDVVVVVVPGFPVEMLVVVVPGFPVEMFVVVVPGLPVEVVEVISVEMFGRFPLRCRRGRSWIPR
ncbi:hypothetical protein RB195_025645 [Necator americanus]|uniref:Uncharacterized protein n=2 Tax=Necator americanus TaxID=51031 RepID=A0ABR1ETA6_NECAM